MSKKIKAKKKKANFCWRTSLVLAETKTMTPMASWSKDAAIDVCRILHPFSEQERAKILRLAKKVLAVLKG